MKKPIKTGQISNITSFSITSSMKQNLARDEQAELEAEQELLGHAEEIKLSLTSASNLFSAEGLSILSMLRDVKNNLGRIRTFLAGKRKPHPENRIHTD